MIGQNEYQCALCKGVFEKGWSDEEVMAESHELWGDFPSEELAVICDDCFHGHTPGTRSYEKVLAEIGGEK